MTYPKGPFSDCFCLTFLCVIFFSILGIIQIWRLWKLFNFQDHHRSCWSTPKILPLPWPWTSNFKRTPPLQMITNQLKENIIQGLLFYVIRSFLQVDFRFQYQLINLVWLSFDFFSFSWRLNICFFVFCDFIPLYVQLSQNITKCLLFISIHTFGTHFATSMFYFHNLKT